MRELSIFLILVALVVLALYRPWIGVMALAVLSYLSPHSYAWGAMGSFPMYMVLFVAVMVSVMVHAFRGSLEFQWPPRDWRLFVLLALWLYFVLTTYQAMSPRFAWPRFFEVSKVLAPLILTLVLINTRQKLFYLIVTIAACIALVTVKGGYWALMTGFSDRVYGPARTAFYDNNHFAVLVVMNIPLLLLWLRETRQRALRYVLMGVMALSACAAVSSWSRGALLALGVTVVLLWLGSRRKYLVVPILAVSVVIAGSLLPEKWFHRMETIASFQQEDSAQGRLRVWKSGAEYALKHPVLGGGFHAWRYVTAGQEGGRLDWHSAYVEMMAEHGLIAFGLWCALLFGTIFGLSRLAWHAARSPPLDWVVNYATMLRASLVAYAIGAVFVGITYWDLLYQIIVFSILLRALSRGAAHEREPASVGNLDISETFPRVT